MDSLGPVKRTAFPACGGICAVLESPEGGDGRLEAGLVVGWG